MNCSRAALIAAMALILGACSETAGPQSSLVTHIDHASLNSTTLNVSFTVTNGGARSEDLPACGGQPSPRVSKQQGGGWDEIGGGICLAIFSSAPISLAPGSSVGATMGLCCLEPGVYRLVISYDLDGSPRAVSPPFKIE